MKPKGLRGAAAIMAATLFLAVPMFGQTSGMNIEFFDGNIACPDGTMRHVPGERPDELMIAVICQASAAETAAAAERAAIALQMKNEELRKQDALRGEYGVWEALKASWEQRSFDYLLSFRLTWFIGFMLVALGLGQLFRSK